MMKNLIKIPLLLGLLLVLNACSATRFDPTLQYSSDPDFGYSPEQPLALYANVEDVASTKTLRFLEKLRTAKGEKLVMVDKTKVNNPNYKKPKIVLYNWITGEQINQGNGRFLMRYDLKSETGKDSLQLFVNHFIKGNLQVPKTLVLADDIDSNTAVVSANR